MRMPRTSGTCACKPLSSNEIARPSAVRRQAPDNIFAVRSTKVGAPGAAHPAVHTHSRTACLFAAHAGNAIAFRDHVVVTFPLHSHREGRTAAMSFRGFAGTWRTRASVMSTSIPARRSWMGRWNVRSPARELKLTWESSHEIRYITQSISWNPAENFEAEGWLSSRWQCLETDHIWANLGHVVSNRLRHWSRTPRHHVTLAK
jgi:hypothetical protein